MSGPQHITSRENAWLKDLRRLSQDSRAYRKRGEVWLEGEHLVDALVRKAHPVQTLVCAESAWAELPAAWRSLGAQQVILPDALFAGLSALDAPARVGAVVRLPETPTIDPHQATVVLDRVQDAGNVGAILRSAAAFGFSQVLALQGTAALWSPKVVRAGMGAHLSLRLCEGLAVADLAALRVPLLATSSHRGPFLHEVVAQGALPHPAAWVLGHEGQGVAPELLARAQQTVRIIQPGGEESLNVAAAAAICLHASASRL